MHIQKYALYLSYRRYNIMGKSKYEVYYPNLTEGSMPESGYQYCFITEFLQNGEKYTGSIWAKNWKEAEEFVKQRAASEKVIGNTLKRLKL